MGLIAEIWFTQTDMNLFFNSQRILLKSSVLNIFYLDEEALEGLVLVLLSNLVLHIETAALQI